jgi:hypothetical protein
MGAGAEGDLTQEGQRHAIGKAMERPQIAGSLRSRGKRTIGCLGLTGRDPFDRMFARAFRDDLPRDRLGMRLMFFRDAEVAVDRQLQKTGSRREQGEDADADVAVLGVIVRQPALQFGAVSRLGVRKL